MRKIFLGCLALTSFAPARDEVRLVGPVCPISIETPATVSQSASARPSLLDQSRIGTVFRLRTEHGFVAEALNQDAELRPMCELVLVDAASVGEVIRQDVDETSAVGINWEDAGKHGGGKLIVDRGQYRFRFTFLLDNPRKNKGIVGLWTVRSVAFHVEKGQAWTTFR